MIVCARCGYHNPPDADFCLNPALPNGQGACGEYLGWAKGEPGNPAAQSPADLVSAEPVSASSSSQAGQVDVSASLAPAQLSVDPGGEVTCEIRVRNRGTVVDRFQLELQGNQGQWSLIEPATLSLFPETESAAVLRFRPPRSPRVHAGPARFRIKATSSTAPAVFALAEGIVEVRPYASLEARIMPQTSGGPDRAMHQVIVDNQGNAPVRVVLAASDPDGALDLRVDPLVLLVEAGASAVTAVGVYARRQVVGGSAQPRPFVVQVEAPDGQGLTLSALFVQEPAPQRPPPPLPAPAPVPSPPAPAAAPRSGLGVGGCLVLLLLVPLLLLGGGVFVLLVRELVQGDANYDDTEYLAYTSGFFLFTVLVLLAMRWVWRRSRKG